MFTRHLNMECFELAIPANFVSYAPTFLSQSVRLYPFLSEHLEISVICLSFKTIRFFFCKRLLVVFSVDVRGVARTVVMCRHWFH